MAEIFGFSVRRPKRRPKVASISIGRFGSVSNATIELADFILLVGRNNTGKSYVANLIWAFRNFRTVFGPRSQHGGLEPPAWLASYLKDASSGDEPLHIRGADMADHINGWLAHNEQLVADRLLSFEGSRLAGLKVRINEDLWLWRRSNPTPAFEQIGKENEASYWEVSLSDPAKMVRPTTYMHESLWGGGGLRDLTIFYEIVELLLNGGNQSGGSTYLPAARSGLMLALPSLYASLLEDLGQKTEDSQTGELPLATARFLRSLTQRRRSVPPRSRHLAIAEFLESEILKGKISRAENASGRFTYAPNGTSENLPLHVTSSLVSEIAPLLYLLRTGGLYGGIVFEEPEAHLHLSAQRAMARAVARLVNTGAPVALTTHSDTFVQQINVLGRLHVHPERKELLQKYGYDSADTIDLSKAIAYEFVQNRKSTKVKKIRPSDGGFAIESINETIIELAQEAIETSSEND